MGQRKQWKNLSPAAKASVLAMISIQISLLVTALNDLRKRPAALVRGPKVLWGAAVFVNYVGPISYFVFGRKRVQQQLPPA